MNERLTARAPMRARRGSGDRGAAVAEFALVLPVLVMLMLGIVSAGLLWNTKLQMAHAVREGARHGSTIPVDQAFDSGTWASNVRTLIVNRSAGDLTSSDVCVALVEGATPAVFDTDSSFTTKGDGTACYDDSGEGDDSLRVQVLAAGAGTIETGFWSWDVDLEAEATAKHEQGAS
jgi:Flp pilus assembly protein TadG